MDGKRNNPAFPAHDDEADVLPGTPARPWAAEPLASLISRRALLKGAGATAATLVVAPAALLPAPDAQARPRHGWRPRRGGRLGFATVAPDAGPDVVVPPNYTWDVVLRWGDPLFADAPGFDVHHQTGEAQARQFGFNADLVLFYPLPGFVRHSVARGGRLGGWAQRTLGLAYPRLRGAPARRALVVVNHEYTSGDDMFPDFDPATYPTPEQARVEIEAHGFSIVELGQGPDGRWRPNRHSPFNRRSTGSTPVDIAGPLRGHPMMRSETDPGGTRVQGTLNNCAGGKTPWGTVLTCEENFDQYFANFAAVREKHPEVAALSERIAAEDGATPRGWERHVGRFDLARDPREYNRFGYVVEVDPYDPASRPRKRTALGRFKHEGAAAAVARDGRVAIYSGDDARFEYVYKFVTERPMDPRNRKANLDLLDHGTLYVAHFGIGEAAGDDRGEGMWLPLIPGATSPVEGAPGLAGWSQAGILLNTRGAADAMGATPMDRPEDIEVSPRSGRVYIALTNNSRRDGEPGDTRMVNGREVSTAADEANPRNHTYDSDDPDRLTGNAHGHVIELVEDGDAGAPTFHWDILVKCGDPAVPAHDCRFGDLTGADAVRAGVSPISDPDNLVHDDDGNLWIATDGMAGSGGAKGFGQNDGVFAVPVAGPERGRLRQFLSGVPGGEVCGPEFSGDNRTFFCAIQHPHSGGAFARHWPLDEARRDRVSKPALIAVRERRRRRVGA